MIHSPLIKNNLIINCMNYFVLNNYLRHSPTIFAKLIFTMRFLNFAQFFALPLSTAQQFRLSKSILIQESQKVEKF